MEVGARKSKLREILVKSLEEAALYITTVCSDA